MVNDRGEGINSKGQCRRGWVVSGVNEGRLVILRGHCNVSRSTGKDLLLVLQG